MKVAYEMLSQEVPLESEELSELHKTALEEAVTYLTAHTLGNYEVVRTKQTRFTVCVRTLRTFRLRTVEIK